MMVGAESARVNPELPDLPCVGAASELHPQVLSVPEWEAGCQQDTMPKRQTQNEAASRMRDNLVQSWRGVVDEFRTLFPEADDNLTVFLSKPVGLFENGCANHAPRGDLP